MASAQRKQIQHVWFLKSAPCAVTTTISPTRVTGRLFLHLSSFRQENYQLTEVSCGQFTLGSVVTTEEGNAWRLRQCVSSKLCMTTAALHGGRAHAAATDRLPDCAWSRCTGFQICINKAPNHSLWLNLCRPIFW